LAELLVDHDAAAPPRVPLRARDARHRLVPDLRPGLRAHRRGTGRRAPYGRPASLRDPLPELLPLPLRLGRCVGGGPRDPPGLAAPVPSPARPHAVLSAA